MYTERMEFFKELPQLVIQLADHVALFCAAGSLGLALVMIGVWGCRRHG